MKKIQLFKSLLVCSLFAFVLASCSGVTYSIDNPTDKEITVTIDNGTPIKLMPNEFKRIESTLSLGEHKMKVDDGSEIIFNLDKDHVILNPTLSTYVVALQEYGTGFASSDNDTIIVIDGIEYEGPFPLVTSDPFIYSGNLNFSIDKPFSDEIKTSKTGTVTMRKIFRKSEFIEYYNKEYK